MVTVLCPSSCCTAASDTRAIDPSYRRALLLELRQYGITRAALFPDLDGLSAYFNWMVAAGLELTSPPAEDP